MRTSAADLELMGALRAAQQLDAAPRSTWALWLMAALLASALAWAALARVNEVTRAEARVMAEGRDQVIASLEGGILAALLVKEGEEVAAGQPLAQMDPTRAEAQQGEGKARRAALAAALARAGAEAAATPLKLPRDASPAVAEAETALYKARQRALLDAQATLRRNVDLARRELAVAEEMSSRGLLSEVEVMRLKRQLNDQQLQIEERANRFRQEASAELARIRSELAQLDEQLVVRDDSMRRTVLRSPVRGLVKNIRFATLGGVVGAGAPILDIVPLSDRVRIEARIRPADIGFVQVGQHAVVKLTAYDYTAYGGLAGTVEYLSPDALGDTERANGGADNSYYRAVIRAEGEGPRAAGKALAITPGMTAQVEVATGERSVLSFLLRPMLKAREAFRER